MGFFDKKQEKAAPAQQRTPFQSEMISALKKLRDAGILTEGEYQEKKQKVLSIR